METLSALLAICVGNSPVPGEFPTQRPVTRSFDVFFDLRLNKRLSKQSRGWWFETLSRQLWRHRNVVAKFDDSVIVWMTCDFLCRQWAPIFVHIRWYLLGCTASIYCIWLRMKIRASQITGVATVCSTACSDWHEKSVFLLIARS